MRRFLRHLFTLCAALSLLLCVAVCALWVDAGVFGRQRLKQFGDLTTGVLLASKRGTLICYWGNLTPKRLALPDFTDWDAPGVRFRVVHQPARSYHLWTSHASAAAVTAVLPA